MMMNSDYYREGDKKLKIGRKLAKENYIEELNIFARKLLLVKKVIPMIYDEILKYFLERKPICEITIDEIIKGKVTL